jgi:hypothetical protein
VALMSSTFPVNDNPRFTIVATTNGQTSLTIPFPFQASADIRIIKQAVNGAETELARPANYSLTGAGNPAGGSATLVAAARTGEIYTILGNAIPTRVENVTRGGKFNSAAMDADLDRLTLMVQELRRDVAQAFRARYGSEPGVVTVGAAGTLPVWNEEGGLDEGPSAAAIDAIETALGVEAGRAMLHGAGGSDPFDAIGRKISGLADATEPDDAVTLQQLDALEGEIDPAGLTERVEKLEQGWRTGDVKFNFDDTAETGWLFAEGGFIGNASSNANVRANADTEALFAHIWARRVKLGATIKTSAGAAAVFGANAAADFAANRQLELPDISKRFPRAAGTGLDVGTKQASQNLAHVHTASTGTAGSHSHNVTRPRRYGANDNSSGNSNPGWDAGDQQSASSDSRATTAAGDHSHSVTVDSSGAAEARPDSFVLRALIRM